MSPATKAPVAPSVPVGPTILTEDEGNDKVSPIVYPEPPLTIVSAPEEDGDVSVIVAVAPAPATLPVNPTV